MVRLAGEHDISTRDKLRRAFQAARENPHVVVDMVGVSYLDSTAVAEIARAAEHAARLPGGKLVIVARNQRLIRLLSIAGLTGVIPIVDTYADALGILGER